jgi:hypothetical protein
MIPTGPSTMVEVSDQDATTIGDYGSLTERMASMKAPESRHDAVGWTVTPVGRHSQDDDAVVTYRRCKAFRPGQRRHPWESLVQNDFLKRRPPVIF